MHIMDIETIHDKEKDKITVNFVTATEGTYKVAFWRGFYTGAILSLVISVIIGLLTK